MIIIWQCCIVMALFIPLCIQVYALTSPVVNEPSRWQRRTAKRRQRTESLLDLIEQKTDDVSTSSMTNDIPTLQIPTQYKINWDEVMPELDPMRGGKIKQGTSKKIERGLRKRAQVECFYYVVSKLLESQNSNVTIIDAGCGAGNLAIGLAGLLLDNNIPNNQHVDDNVDDNILNNQHVDNNIPNNQHVNVLAVDVNNHALQRLEERAKTILPSGYLKTCCEDLANIQEILAQVPSGNSVMVISLHACGSASDMAMELAFACDAPFAICPCCTAKSLTKRSDILTQQNSYDTSASFIRSGATTDINYPRSTWLRSRMVGQDGEEYISIEEQYTTLAKVADVGLGPQTPSQQREHQRRAKHIVEMDRLRYASEEHGYNVSLMRIEGHDPKVYGKGEILLGTKNELFAYETLS